MTSHTQVHGNMECMYACHPTGTMHQCWKHDLLGLQKVALHDGHVRNGTSAASSQRCCECRRATKEHCNGWLSHHYRETRRDVMAIFRVNQWRCLFATSCAQLSSIALPKMRVLVQCSPTHEQVPSRSTFDDQTPPDRTFLTRLTPGRT